MLNMALVALGAAVGANLRYGLSLWAARRFGAEFPLGTMVINIVGCLVIGALLTLAAARLPLGDSLRLLLVTGLLGGFTTFSSFGYESYTLIVAGRWLAAGVYVGVSVVGGLLAVFLGAGLMRLVAG